MRCAASPPIEAPVPLLAAVVNPAPVSASVPHSPFSHLKFAFLFPRASTDTVPRRAWQPALECSGVRRRFYGRLLDQESLLSHPARAHVYALQALPSAQRPAALRFHQVDSSNPVFRLRAIPLPFPPPSFRSLRLPPRRGLAQRHRSSFLALEV